MALVLALVGLLLGPALGIAVDRVIDRERLAPVHRCPSCKADLGRPIPILSWFRTCPKDSSHKRWRYLSTDVLSAALFAVAGARYGLSWQLWPILVVFALFVVMAVTDWEHHLLVNELTGAAFAVTISSVVILGGIFEYNDGIAPALVSGTVVGVFLLVAFIAYPPGLGFGDVKLAPTLGLLMGWQTGDVLEGLALTMRGLIVGMLGGALVGLALKWHNRKLSDEERAALPEDWVPGEVPLGPFLILGTVAMLAITPSAALA